MYIGLKSYLMMFCFFFNSSSQQGKYVIKNVDAKSQLIFTKLSVDNDGMYQCTASNEKDTIYSTGRLKVKIMKGKSM